MDIFNETFKEIFISIDIEATGPIPGSYSMSSIGAYVAGGRTIDNEILMFTQDAHTENPVIDQEDVFYAELSPIPGSTFKTDAIKVGILENMSQDEADNDHTGEIRWQHMIDNGEKPKQVMEDFVKWVNKSIDKYTHPDQKRNPQATFMAFPASFDWMWVYWYMIHFDQKSPFGFSGVLDLKNYYAAKNSIEIRAASKRKFPKHFFSKMKHTHKADDDAIEQGIMGMNMLICFEEDL